LGTHPKSRIALSTALLLSLAACGGGACSSRASRPRSRRP